MSPIVTVYATFGTAEEAERIGLAMVLTLFIFATWNDLVTLPW